MMFFMNGDIWLIFWIKIVFAIIALTISCDKWLQLLSFFTKRLPSSIIIPKSISSLPIFIHCWLEDGLLGSLAINTIPCVLVTPPPSLPSPPQAPLDSAALPLNSKLAKQLQQKFHCQTEGEEGMWTSEGGELRGVPNLGRVHVAMIGNGGRWERMYACTVCGARERRVGYGVEEAIMKEEEMYP
jgi:hypothetical protein